MQTDSVGLAGAWDSSTCSVYPESQNFRPCSQKLISKGWCGSPPWVWYQVALACNGLEWGLGSQPEIEAASQQWKHQILATTQVVSDKGLGPSAMQKRIPTKIESSEASRIFIKRKKRVQYMWIDTEAGLEREWLSHVLMAVWTTLWSLSSCFPLANHFDLPSSQSIFGKSQDIPCAFTHLLAKMDSTRKAYG